VRICPKVLAEKFQHMLELTPPKLVVDGEVGETGHHCGTVNTHSANNFAIVFKLVVASNQFMCIFNISNILNIKYTRVVLLTLMSQ